MKAKNWPIVLEYAESIRDGKKIACEELKHAVSRFFADLENPEYELTHKDPEFCIQVIEKTLCHQQGEKLDGTPLRGKPFLLEPFHKFRHTLEQTVAVIDDTVHIADKALFRAQQFKFLVHIPVFSPFGCILSPNPIMRTNRGTVKGKRADGL